MLHSLVILQVSEEALDKRHKQGWVLHKVTNLEDCINMIREGRRNGISTSIGFLGKLVYMLPFT